MLVRLGLVAAGALTLSGCQSIQGTEPGAPEVRFVDVSPDAPGLDFYLNKTVLAYNLGVNTYTNYIPVNAGNYTVTANQYSTTSVLASAGISVKTNQRYTVVAGNVLASLQLTALTDASGPAPSGAYNVRLLDESTASGAVDVYFIPTGGKLTTTAPVVTYLTFGNNSGYLNVPAGTYQIAIVPAGTVPISTTVTSYTGPTLTLAQGGAGTFIIDDKQIVTTPTLNVVQLNDYPAS